MLAVYHKKFLNIIFATTVSPADRAGVKAGDLLVSLNGLLVLFLPAGDSLHLLETMAGNTATLQLERSAAKDAYKSDVAVSGSARLADYF